MSIVPAASGYPANLTFLARRLSQFSRNTVKLQPLNMTSASAGISAGQPISVMLPSNTILDLDTFTMYFKGSTISPSGAPAAIFPKNIESIIRNLTVQSGDRIIDNIQEYNRIFNLILDHTAGKDCDLKRKIMSNGGDEVQKLIQKPFTATDVPLERRYAISAWLGFLGSATPRMVDMSIMSPLKITMELAQSAILVKNAVSATPGAQPTYQLSDIFFTIDTINVADNMLSAMYQKMLMSSPDAYLEIPYSRWSTANSVGGASGSTVFNVSSQSLDMCIACFSPVVSQADTFADSYGSSSTLGSSPYFLRPSAFRGVQGSTPPRFEVIDWQYNIGGRYLPAWNVTNDLTYAVNMDALQASRDLLGGVTTTIEGAIFAAADPDDVHVLYPPGPTATVTNGVVVVTPGVNDALYAVSPLNEAYLSAYAAFIIHLNNNEERGWISGLNTSGNVLYSQFNWNGRGANIANALQNFVFCKTTSSFIVKAGRQCDVIL